MFNLNKNEKYNKINDNTASIYCTKEHGPWTYCFGFSINTSMKIIKHCGFDINNAYEKGCNILLNSSNEVQTFNVDEVEVYKIIVDN